MHCVLCLSFILLVYTSCSVQAVVRQRSQADILNDINEKVNDLWNVYGSKYPLLNNADRMLYAICNLQPNPKLNVTEPKITGQILFKQAYPQGKLEAHFAVQGFPLNPIGSARAIHIHTFGDLSNGCDSAGGHYNPYSVNHPHHLGDFGNFHVQNGEIQQHLSNLEASLFGPVSVMGRSVVLHKFLDDLGKGNNQASLENGNAGPRLACCVIGFTNKAAWDKCMQGSDNK
ncbi:PREDICTED: extracellular superoxide dismutase [Cu-Zn]-like [Nanorana parkeri]|uniref:extracellular superoxide dismutase [Cu-Zn]-like n=1 Tax=Nanorana parkeri TaxID=125878 RepID=UPI0008541DD6|nr:PREDICTED: extracellular superoxide dismutase [Cu-Zn]-like [Nanorana parkeri]